MSLLITTPPWIVGVRGSTSVHLCACAGNARTSQPCGQRLDESGGLTSFTFYSVSSVDGTGGGRQDWLPGRHRHLEVSGDCRARREAIRQRFLKCIATSAKACVTTISPERGLSPSQLARGHPQELFDLCTSSICALRFPEAIKSIVAHHNVFVNKF